MMNKITLATILITTALACVNAITWEGDVNQPSIPLPRTPAPDFTATAVLHDDFTKVSLSDYTSKGQWLVLFFYPFDYTFVCPTEIRSFSDAAGKFSEMNVGVAAVSTDR
ncbi:hypothetical protein TrRE_jg799 [Triparma retinervis]|uniref:Thioredoxin domain-containing protein n=1 Tax=Triparma retinervis TaxID=2557542 RepID=A0A9W7ADJ2_9STRA|nr:hypothetical protein TrRE_jg799 [Triparma retinervis]